MSVCAVVCFCVSVDREISLSTFVFSVSAGVGVKF